MKEIKQEFQNFRITDPLDKKDALLFCYCVALLLCYNVTLLPGSLLILGIGLKGNGKTTAANLFFSLVGHEKKNLAHQLSEV